MFNQKKYFLRLTFVFGCIILYKILTLYLFPTNFEIFASQEDLYSEERRNLSRLYWMISLIGGLIILTLSYVSWRKYKAEKKKKKKDSNS